MFLGEEISIFLSSKKHMKPLEIGALHGLLEHYVERGRLPTGDEELRRIVQVGPKRWAKLKPAVMACFDADGMPLDARYVLFLRSEMRNGRIQFMVPDGDRSDGQVRS